MHRPKPNLAINLCVVPYIGLYLMIFSRNCIAHRASYPLPCHASQLQICPQMYWSVIGLYGAFLTLMILSQPSPPPKKKGNSGDGHIPRRRAHQPFPCKYQYIMSCTLLNVTCPSRRFHFFYFYLFLGGFPGE